MPLHAASMRSANNVYCVVRNMSRNGRMSAQGSRSLLYRQNERNKESNRKAMKLRETLHLPSTRKAWGRYIVRIDGCAYETIQSIPNPRNNSFSSYLTRLFCGTEPRWRSWLRLQTGRSGVRFPMVSLGFFIGIILWVASAFNGNEYQEYFLGRKGGRCVWLTTLPLSSADCLEIWEPQPPGTRRACPGL
jgi:hypothetical protein